MYMETILITGGTGNIGKELSSLLLSRGYRVAVLTRKKNIHDSRIEYFYWDVKNKTIENYNNNIIRSTSECMSGILGGCDFIKSIPYDIKFKNRNEFSERIKWNNGCIAYLGNFVFVSYF